MSGSIIGYSIVDTPLGLLLVAGTERGVCNVRFGAAREELEAGLRGEFPFAVFARDAARLAPWVEELLAYLEGRSRQLAIPLDVRGSRFQRRVWEALRAIPYGRTRSYSDVAVAVGRPSAARAVARACAVNPVPLVVPCHRVVEKGGGLGGYRYGAERKRRLLAQEARGCAGGSAAVACAKGRSASAAAPSCQLLANQVLLGG